MDFAYSTEQEELRRLAEDVFARADDPARLATVEAGADWFDRDLWGQLAQANLLGVTVPTAEGGLGFGLLEACLVLERCGWALGHVPLLSTVVGGVLPVARFGPAELRQELFGGVLSGATVLTAGLADRGPGSLRAARAGGGWVLEGERGFVPYAHLARAVVLPASTEGGEGLFLVELGSEALELERQQTMSGDPQFLLRLSGTPATALAEPGPAGAEAVRWARQHTQVAYCALELGLAERALRLAADYTGERVQFGRPIATFQAVGHRLADAYIDVLAMRWTMLAAACALDEGGPADEAVGTAKWWACEGGHRVVSAAQHCHGGVGVDMRYPLYRYFLWSKEVEVTLGSGAEQLAELGRQIAGMPGPAPVAS